MRYLLKLGRRPLCSVRTMIWLTILKGVAVAMGVDTIKKVVCAVGIDTYSLRVRLVIPKRYTYAVDEDFAHEINNIPPWVTISFMGGDILSMDDCDPPMTYKTLTDSVKLWKVIVNCWHSNEGFLSGRAAAIKGYRLRERNDGKSERGSAAWGIGFENASQWGAGSAKSRFWEGRYLTLVTSK